MYNLLIADDNILYVKKMINLILSNNEDIRLVNIATDGKETLNYIKNEKIDLVILDIYMPICSGLEVLKKLEYETRINIPKIIIISGVLSNINKVVNNKNVIDFIPKSVGIDVMVQKINIIVESMKQEKNIKIVERYVKAELMNLKYNFKYVGTIYIFETILFIINSNNIDLLENLEKNVYSIVAMRHKKTVNNIKSDIVKATNIMYNDCTLNYLLQYFSFEQDTKPTPKLIISTIVNKYIRNEEKIH